MIISISRHGYNVDYICCKRPKKCPDEDTEKCYTCKYCKAEMSAYDATRLLKGIGRGKDT